MSGLFRGERLQIMLSPEELEALDDWRFKSRMPSRAAAVRELLMRGLHAGGFPLADARTKSADFGVLGDGGGAASAGNGDGRTNPNGIGRDGHRLSHAARPK
jgi:hypothetical protein